MITSILKSLSVALMLSPTAAQFGVNKGFEELNKMAKESLEKEEKGLGGGIGDIATLIDQFSGNGVDASDLMAIVEESMRDPHMAQYFETMGEQMQDAMSQIQGMSPDQLKATLKDNIEKMTSTEMFDNILEHKDEVLKSLKENGLVSDDEIEQYLSNPEKFQENIAEAFSEMQEIFSDPTSIDAMSDLMKSVSDVMNDPSVVMGSINARLEEELQTDEQIEAARLELLNSPEKAGTRALSEMFQDESMREILEDPVKWRNQVKRGKQLLNSFGEAGGAIHGGEAGHLAGEL